MSIAAPCSLIKSLPKTADAQANANSVAVPGPPGALWVPAYGVRRPGTPVRIPGEPACGYGANYFVGFCAGMPAFASYISGSQDLDIHF